jgi:hypothetical protein
VKEEAAEETLGQLRDRLALALAHGPARVDCRIKVEDSTSGEDEDGNGEEEEEEGTVGQEGHGEGEEEGLGGEGGLVLLAGAAHVPGDDGRRGGAPRRSTPADRAARAKRGRSDAAAGDDVPDAPLPKRQTGGAQAGPSGRHGVYELIRKSIGKATPWLRWRARLKLQGNIALELGTFGTVDAAARAYDGAAVRVGAREAPELPAAGGAGGIPAGRGALRRARPAPVARTGAACRYPGRLRRAGRLGSAAAEAQSSKAWQEWLLRRDEKQ